MSYVTCDNCDNFASKALSEAVGWNACGPCVTGEADTIDEYTDYFEKGGANLRPHGTSSPARAARNAQRGTRSEERAAPEEPQPAPRGSRRPGQATARAMRGEIHGAQQRPPSRDPGHRAGHRLLAQLREVPHPRL